MSGDRNFDDLAPRFQRNVYGRLKGRIRLAVLERDIKEFLPQVLQLANNKPLRILDAGGGTAPFSLAFAELGHYVTLCDVSKEMLNIAAAQVAEKQLEKNVEIIHGSIQSLPLDLAPFDLILCHAVLEWVENPQAIIHHLTRLLKNTGLFSLTFYNLYGTIYKNLLRANYKKIQQQDYSGFRGSLTPTHPRKPEDVLQWVEQEELDILCHSGMRVFNDYILDTPLREQNPETVIAMELQFSRQLPFRDLGRYQHILLVKQ